MTTIFEMTEQNMETNGHDAYSYFRQQYADQLFATTPITETEPEVTSEPETVATSGKRTYTPEQQAKRNEQRRARRMQGKAN